MYLRMPVVLRMPGMTKGIATNNRVRSPEKFDLMQPHERDTADGINLQGRSSDCLARV